MLLFLLLFSPLLLTAQTKFDPVQLRDPKKHGPAVAATLNTLEVYEYRTDSASNHIALKNGLRSSQFVNAKDWEAIKDTVEAYRVDVVYSKYPLRNGEYREIYPLLFNRLSELFKIDPSLNDASIQWNKALQTHCTSDEQVNTLFHGVVIWYRVDSDNTPMPAEKDVPVTVARTPDDEQSSIEELTQSIEYFKSSSLFSDSIKEVLEGRPLEEQTELLIDYLHEEIGKMPDTPLKNATEEEKAKYGKEVKKFLQHYKPFDNTVAEVLSRHPEWKNILVVNDWTGSMYGYGAQVLEWHLLNFEKSGITSITLFNDGDAKRTAAKKVGTTGGIYSEKADNVEKLIKLFNLVIMKGGGGDGPENDIEGILTAMETFPDHSEIVLIADNNACVRDIELADRIGKPVKVVLCGYSKERGVNPDYVYLARKTGGGIYTIEEDIENIEASLGTKGKVEALSDSRLRLVSSHCKDGFLLGSTRSAYEGKVFKEYNKARWKKRRIRQLDLAGQDLPGVPKGVYKMRRLQNLDLSENNIRHLSGKIERLGYLGTLNLSKNRLTSLPPELKNVVFLTELDVSYNSLAVLPYSVLSLKFLQKLDASNNKIAKIPTSNRLRKLEWLDLSNNEITEIPRSFGSMKKLVYLDLSNNDIKQLPSHIAGMTNLEALNLSNNQLTTLPQGFEKLKKLKKLHLANNLLSDEEKKKIRAALPNTEVIF